MTNFKPILTIVIIALVFLTFIFLMATFKIPSQFPTQEPSSPSLSKIPQGRQEYYVAEDNKNWPKFVKIVVDPVDVKPGDIQKYEVVLRDKEKVGLVVAFIERDNGTTTIRLEKISEKFTAGQGDVSFSLFKDFFKKDKENIYEYTFRGQWKVFDTSARKYTTLIRAMNFKGAINEVTIAWYDPCNIPLGGDWAVDGNCTINSLTGVDNGNLTGFLSNYTLTLNAPFVINPGKSITINKGGKILIGTGGKIQQTYLWCKDGDNDNYCLSNFLAQDTQPSSYKRRYSALSINDCNDNDFNVWREVYAYFDEDGDGYAGSGPYSLCIGNSLPSGYSESWSDCYDVFDQWGPLYNPGSGFQTSPGPIGWDFNCDYIVEKRDPYIAICVLGQQCVPYHFYSRECYDSGWATPSIPECGISDEYIIVPPGGCGFDCVYDTCLYKSNTQACR